MWLRDIYDISSAWRHSFYLYLVLLKMLILFRMSRWTQSFVWTIPFMSWSNLVISIYIRHMFFQAQICTNDYFAPNYFSAKGDNLVFPSYLVRTTDEESHPLCLYFHGEFFVIWCSTLIIFWSMRRSPTRDWLGAVSVLYILL